LFAPFQSRDFLKPAIRFARAACVMIEDGLGKVEAHGLQIVAKCIRRFSWIRQRHVYNKGISDA
jgi:hypothetical protein